MEAYQQQLINKELPAFMCYDTTNKSREFFIMGKFQRWNSNIWLFRTKQIVNYS